MITCPDCKRSTSDSLPQRIGLLKARGRLLRDKQPDPTVVNELLLLELPHLVCNFCGHVGLSIREGSDLDGEGLADEQWGEARRCIGCNVVIDAERLEILPDTQQCTACSLAGRTSPQDQREFCSKCGSELKLVQRGGRGLAGYVMKCADCG